MNNFEERGSQSFFKAFSARLFLHGCTMPFSEVQCALFSKKIGVKHYKHKECKTKTALLFDFEK